MKETNNSLLTNYLQGKNPYNYYGINAPNRIIINVCGINRAFQYVNCLSSMKQKGNISEAVYQSTEQNRYGLYPVFSIVVKKDKGSYDFYVNCLDGTRAWM